MQKLRYKDFEIEEPKSNFQAELFMQMSGEIYKLKAEVSELRQELYKQDARHKYGEVSDAKEAMAILKMNRDKFRKLCNSVDFKSRVRMRLNSKNARFFLTADLIDYAQYIFSEDFSHNEYFMNPEFYEKQGVGSAHKNFERYKKKQ